MESPSSNAHAGSPDSGTAVFRIEVDDGMVGRGLVTAIGELDIASSDALTDTLRDLASRDSTIVLDITELRFIDSSGLHALVTAHQEAEQAGHVFALTRGTPAVERVLDICGLASIFKREPQYG